MLFEWFQKRQQPRPKIDIVSEGRRFRATVNVSGLLYELPEGGVACTLHPCLLPLMPAPLFLLFCCRLACCLRPPRPPSTPPLMLQASPATTTH